MKVEFCEDRELHITYWGTGSEVELMVKRVVYEKIDFNGQYRFDTLGV